MDRIKHTAEAVSLGMTVPTVILSAMVCLLFVKPAWESWKKSAAERKAINWFQIGIFVSFFGFTLDNIYWAVPWTLSFVGSEWRKPWFEWGALANIFNRQFCGIVAAYFHCRCAFEIAHGETSPELRALNKKTFWATIGGGIYVAFLVVLRWLGGVK